MEQAQQTEQRALHRRAVVDALSNGEFAGHYGFEVRLPAALSEEMAATGIADMREEIKRLEGLRQQL